MNMPKDGPIFKGVNICITNRNRTNINTAQKLSIAVVLCEPKIIIMENKIIINAIILENSEFSLLKKILHRIVVITPICPSSFLCGVNPRHVPKTGSFAPGTVKTDINVKIIYK